MKTYYIGHTKDGVLVSRGSTRPDFAWAAVLGSRASFSATRQGAVANRTAYLDDKTCELVEVKAVDAATYRAARKAAGDNQITAG